MIGVKARRLQVVGFLCLTAACDVAARDWIPRLPSMTAPKKKKKKCRRTVRPGEEPILTQLSRDDALWLQKLPVSLGDALRGASCANSTYLLPFRLVSAEMYLILRANHTVQNGWLGARISFCTLNPVRHEGSTGKGFRSPVVAGGLRLPQVLPGLVWPPRHPVARGSRTHPLNGSLVVPSVTV